MISDTNIRYQFIVGLEVADVKTYKIAVIPGDGTGPEVVNEGKKVLEAVGRKFGFKYE